MLRHFSGEQLTYSSLAFSCAKSGLLIEFLLYNGLQPQRRESERSCRYEGKSIQVELLLGILQYMDHLVDNILTDVH
jgi:hypothetical protein